MKEENHTQPKKLFDPTELLAAQGAKRLTRQDIAAKLGHDQATVRKVFEGRDTKISTLRRVARALGCKVKIEIERAA